MYDLSRFSVGIFDIDGCVIDSRAECFEVLRILYQDDDLGTIDGVKENFMRYRFLVRTADQFKSLVEALLCANEDIRRSFLKNEEQYTNRERKYFLKKFFEIRAEIIAKDKLAWLNLHNVYPKFAKIRDFYSLVRHPYIVSAKNSRAIKEILDYFEFNTNICGVYGGEEFDKEHHFKTILNAHPNENVFIIDDNLDNLSFAHMLGISGFLADWGYVDLEEHNANNVRSYSNGSDCIFN